MEPVQGLSKEFKLGLAATALTTVVAATGAPWWVQYFNDDAPAETAKTPDAPAPSAVTGEPVVNSPVAGMTGGCKPFQVFAQNRWAPYGTAIREQPNVLSTQVGSFPGNMSLSVNGWVHSRAAYPTNPPPFNNNVWYHLSNGVGWVSFPGVRATSTPQDPTGLSDQGGTPAAMSPRCKGAVR